MRVRLRDEGRIFSGTATQVVQQMQGTAIFAAHLTLGEYVDWCVQNAGQMGLAVKVTGETVDERHRRQASSRRGTAKRLAFG